MKHPRLFAFCLLLMLMLFAYIQTNAQEVELQKSKPFVFKTEKLAIGNALKTSYFAYVGKNRYDYYLTNRGSYYYVSLNKKGEYVRHYNKDLKEVKH